MILNSINFKMIICPNLLPEDRLQNPKAKTKLKLEELSELKQWATAMNS